MSVIFGPSQMCLKILWHTLYLYMYVCMCACTYVYTCVCVIHSHSFIWAARHSSRPILDLIPSSQWPLEVEYRSELLGCSSGHGLQLRTGLQERLCTLPGASSEKEPALLCPSFPWQGGPRWSPATAWERQDILIQRLTVFCATGR